MIFAVQVEIENPADAGLGHVIAETPNVADLNGGLMKPRSVLACRRPVEPMSTSASSAPTTVLPGLTNPVSMPPCNVGTEPNDPVQSRVAKSSTELRSHGSPVIAIVPPAPIEIAGSESPFVVFRRVIENAVPPLGPAAVGSANAALANTHKVTTTPNRNSLAMLSPPRSFRRQSSTRLMSPLAIYRPS